MLFVYNFKPLRYAGHGAPHFYVTFDKIGDFLLKVIEAEMKEKPNIKDNTTTSRAIDLKESRRLPDLTRKYAYQSVVMRLRRAGFTPDPILMQNFDLSAPSSTHTVGKIFNLTRIKNVVSRHLYYVLLLFTSPKLITLLFCTS